MKMIKNIFIVLFLLCFFSLSAFFFPRWLNAHFGEGHFISSYLYIYGSGLPFFVMGVWFLIRSKALNFTLIGEKKWLLFFIAGLFWNMLMHGIWIFFAVQVPFKGTV